MGDMRARRRTIFWIALGLLLIGMAACSKEEAKKPSRWDSTQQKSEGQKATAKQAIAGGEFNKFFPQSGGGFSVVYTQEKIGFAQAKVEKDGKELATLAIFDTISTPDAAEKILSGLNRFVELSDSKLDYVAAFLDMTTNYYEHTGTQTIARRLVERAVNEI